MLDEVADVTQKMSQAELHQNVAILHVLAV
jgi:hypothetical protein